MWKHLLALVVAFALMGEDVSAQPRVANVKAQALPDKRVEVTYDLLGASGVQAKVELWVSRDRGRSFPIQARALSGDAGASVTPGEGKRILWDALKDVASLKGSEVVFKVVAILPERFASLVFHSNVEGAEIWVNRALRGRTAHGTGVRVGRLPPGNYQVEVRKRGYRPFTAMVRLEAGEEFSFEARLEEEFRPPPPPPPREQPAPRQPPPPPPIIGF